MAGGGKAQAASRASHWRAGQWSVNNAWLLLLAAREGPGPHPRVSAVAGYKSSLSEATRTVLPRRILTLPSSLASQPVCPRSTILVSLASWVEPNFQAVCFLTSEISQKRETHPPTSQTLRTCTHGRCAPYRRLMSQAARTEPARLKGPESHLYFPGG